MLNEIFVPLPDIPDFAHINKSLYAVSSLGRIRNFQFMEGTPNAYKVPDEHSKSLVVKFTNNGKSAHMNLAKVILLAFSYRPDYKEHRALSFDGNKYNCNIDNLYWDDYTKYGKQLLTVPGYYDMPVINDERWAPMLNIGELFNVNTFGHYVSTYGRIYNITNNKATLISIRQPSVPTRRTYVELPAINGYIDFKVDRLVMLTFNYIPDSINHDIIHLNNDLRDCRLENMVWS